MGDIHDSLATRFGDEILSRIRKSDNDFKQIFSTTIIRTGDWDWPRPDYVCYDETLKATYALEFKPPFQTKREYLTGLGQSVSYLQKHNYSGLIVPETADDGFKIADFIKNTFISPEFNDVGISLFSYNPTNFKLNILKAIEKIRTENGAAVMPGEIKTFWCWWRDMSHYELYDLLNLSYIYSDIGGDIYTKCIYPEFYNAMIHHGTKQWDGTPRHKNGSFQSMKSEKQNYKIPLVQLDLFTREEGRLTDKGFELLSIGKKYGPNSNAFLDRLAYLVLVDGRHLDLINLVNRFQMEHDVPSLSNNYAVALEQYLSDQGCIGKRKPGAVKTGAKNSYMRDEMKLWNKLGFLCSRSAHEYFYPEKGYVFDWERISNVLINNK